jgi:hypothetical protein
MSDEKRDRQEELEGRTHELKEWNEHRKSEVLLDLWRHAERCLPGLIGTVLLWKLLDYLSVSDRSVWRIIVVYAGAAYLAGTVIAWLRIWGSYVERRLEEIEARINGDYPTYYSQESPDRILRNGLHERLQDIENKLEELQR